MKQDFTELFEIIWNNFSPPKKERKSLAAFARYLEHDHEGKVTAWKKGQWPSAYDCWGLHQKMGFALEWLLTGEGEMYGGGGPKPPTPHIDAKLLQQVVELLEEHLQAVKGKLSPAKKAMVISQLYELVIEQEEQAREPIQMMRLVMGALAKAANE